jgi:hypothetical protein
MLLQKIMGNNMGDILGELAEEACQGDFGHQGLIEKKKDFFLSAVDFFLFLLAD